MGGRLSRRRSRRQKQCRNDDHSPVATQDQIVDLRAETIAEIEALRAERDMERAETRAELDSVGAVLRDLQSLAIAMAKAVDGHRDKYLN